MSHQTSEAFNVTGQQVMTAPPKISLGVGNVISRYAPVNIMSTNAILVGGAVIVSNALSQPVSTIATGLYAARL